MAIVMDTIHVDSQLGQGKKSMCVGDLDWAVMLYLNWCTNKFRETVLILVAAFGQ